jgi:hypothetical protein
MFDHKQLAPPPTVGRERSNVNDVRFVGRCRHNVNAISSCCDRVGHDADYLANVKAMSTNCFKCGCGNHIAKDCPQGLMCTKCGHRGHTANVSKAQGKGMKRSGNNGREL